MRSNIQNLEEKEEMLRRKSRNWLIYLARPIWYLFWDFFPEGIMKDLVRDLWVKFANSAPNEIAIRRGDTVTLVGAPPGGEYLRMAKIVGENGHVIVIEPEKGNLEKLNREIEEMSLRNKVTVVPKGAYSEKGKQILKGSPHPLDHKIEIEGVEHDNDLRPENYQFIQEIYVDTLDNILRELAVDKVDFIKIAVNGAELEVLKGMAETLNRVSRLWIKGHAKLRGQPINRVIVSMLRDKGFNAKIIEGGDAPISKDFVRTGDVYAERSKSKRTWGA